MANTKISALTSATTPLAGTEVLPIVQSGATVKVANNDLRPKQIQSNATTGVLQVAGPTAASTRVMTTPDANFTAARIDASQSFTGDQTLSTGNIIQGTAAKGFNFTANIPAAGMTSQLFNWYEEGPFTPTIVGLTTAGTATYAYQYGRYTRIGNRVMFNIYIQWSLHTGTGFLSIAGLPFTTNAGNPNYHSVTIGQVNTIPTTINTIPMALIYNNSTSIRLWETPIGGGATGGVAMTAAANISLSGQYMI